MNILTEDEVSRAIYNVGLGTVERFSVAELVSAILLIKETTTDAYEKFVGEPDQEKFLDVVKLGTQRMYDQIIEKMEE
jgi:hypothetical protein